MLNAKRFTLMQFISLQPLCPVSKSSQSLKLSLQTAVNALQTDHCVHARSEPDVNLPELRTCLLCGVPHISEVL